MAGCVANPPENAATNAAGNSAGNAATSTPAANTEMADFASSPQGLKGKLKDNYVNFSFKYPQSWTVKEVGQTEGAQNYVKVERGIDDSSKGEFTLENFGVGYLSTTGDEAKNDEFYPKLVEQLSSQFASEFPNYKKVSEGKVTINGIQGYEFRFESRVEKTERGPVTLWGRTVLLPKPDSKQGVALIMLASNLAPEIKSAADVGEKGQLPAILQTFKFEAAKPAADATPASAQ